MELDAIDPDVLMQMVTDCIEQHIEAGEIERIVLIESAEREAFEDFMAGLPELNQRTEVQHE